MPNTNIIGVGSQTPPDDIGLLIVDYMATEQSDAHFSFQQTDSPMTDLFQWIQPGDTTCVIDAMIGSSSSLVNKINLEMIDNEQHHYSNHGVSCITVLQLGLTLEKFTLPIVIYAINVNHEAFRTTDLNTITQNIWHDINNTL